MSLEAIITYYIAFGIVCAVQWVPVSQRRFVVRWIPPYLRSSTFVGTTLALVVVALLWPVYARLRGLELRRQLEEAEAERDELALLVYGPPIKETPDANPARGLLPPVCEDPPVSL